MTTRYRIRGEVTRADTRDLTRVHQFEGLAQLTAAFDLTQIIPALIGSIDYAVATYGISAFEDIYIFTDSPIMLSIEGGTAFEVDEFFILRGTSCTDFTLSNTLSSDATARVLFGGS